MKKRGSYFENTFIAKNVIFAVYEDGIIKSRCWDISITLSSEAKYISSEISIQGLAIPDWIHALLGQKLLIREETDYTSHFTNRISVNEFGDYYISELLELILKPNLPESIAIQSVEIANHT